MEDNCKNRWTLHLPLNLSTNEVSRKRKREMLTGKTGDTTMGIKLIKRIQSAVPDYKMYRISQGGVKTYAVVWGATWKDMKEHLLGVREWPTPIELFSTFTEARAHMYNL